MKWILVLGALALTPLLAAPPSDNPEDYQRAKQLKEYLKKEKPAFDRRETQRKDIIEDVDKLNQEQNQVRQRLSQIGMSHQELTMALENLSMEVLKQQEMERAQKKRLVALLKIVYRVRRDGVLRFLVLGDDLTTMAGRFRILYRTLRSHTQISRQLAERASRLSESEQKLLAARGGLQKILGELKEQEGILSQLLERKRITLTNVNVKQSAFQKAMREYRQVSSHVASLFDNFEAMREPDDHLFPNRGSLPLPIEVGHVVKNFGRSVHEKFHTVTYQKGIEIEAEHNAPVTSILPGLVEYEGWVRGLGNVVIVHHGGGFYSLSAHLFKSVKKQGSRVQQGEIIGLVGDTGSSDKPSLYFEIRENGKAVDPLAYFSVNARKQLN